MSFKKVLINTSYILISQQLSKVIRFFVVIILIRYLGKDSFGVWSVVQAIPSMFLVLGNMGINGILVRQVARNKSITKDIVAQVFSIKLILSLFFIGFVYVFTILFQYESDVKRLILIVSIAHVAISYTQIIASVFRASEKFGFEAFMQIIRSITLFLIVCLVILFDLKLKGLVCGLLIGWVLLSICCLAWYRKKYGLSMHLFNFESYTCLLKSALPFALQEFINPLFMQINIILLSHLSTFESVALYNAPYKIILFLYAFVFALRRALFPTLSKLSIIDREKYIKTFYNAAKIIALIGFPIAIGILLLSKEIIFLLFSKNFAESVIPLKIMAITLILYYFRSLFNVTLYASNKEWHASIVFILATLLNIILAVILIPKWDYIGPCVATLISETFIVICGYYLISSNCFKITYLNTGVRLALSILTMSILMMLSTKLSLPIQIAIGAIGYGISICIFKVISLQEYRNIIKMIKIS
ncbi:flippase [bacterium]|nr:flippase [bacterium]